MSLIHEGTVAENNKNCGKTLQVYLTVARILSTSSLNPSLSI
jgi:hypothetical protein